MERYLGHDCETGGTNATKHSLLTYYAAVYDFDRATKRFTLLREIDLKIKPNVGDSYVVTAEALAINKIDLIKHDAEAITIDQAAEKLYYFLKEASNDGNNRLIRMGHNEAFDANFVVSNLLKPAIWGKFTDYGGVMDSSVMARERKMTGKLPWNTRFRLETLAEFLGLMVDKSKVHTAKGDTHLMVACIEKMLSL